MKSPYQIAKEIGVSHQSVYRRLETTLRNEMQGHVHTSEKGKMLIDADGEEIIRNSFAKQEETVSQSETEVEFLRKQVAFLTEQLVELTRNNQVLMLESAKKREKKGFWSWFRKDDML